MNSQPVTARPSRQCSIGDYWCTHCHENIAVDAEGCWYHINTEATLCWIKKVTA